MSSSEEKEEKADRKADAHEQGEPLLESILCVYALRDDEKDDLCLLPASCEKKRLLQLTPAYASINLAFEQQHSTTIWPTRNVLSLLPGTPAAAVSYLQRVYRSAQQSKSAVRYPWKGSRLHGATLQCLAKYWNSISAWAFEHCIRASQEHKYDDPSTVIQLLFEFVKSLRDTDPRHLEHYVMVFSGHIRRFSVVQGCVPKRFQ